MDYVDKLLADYPLVFRVKPYCGVSYGEGWDAVLRDLCSKITLVLQTQSDEVKESFHVDQIKEKFGGLRFYFGGGGEFHGVIEDLVRAAESKAYRTCEKCGKYGQATKDGWIRVLCKEHTEERNAAK